MKILILILALLSSNFVFSQIKIDTLEISYYISGTAVIKSNVPQVSGEINFVAKDKINSDIKGYFMAVAHEDSATYVQNLLNEYDLNSLTEYFEKIKTGQLILNSEVESFEITFISDNILNFTYSHQILPVGGQYQFSFKSIIYDFRTGEKLDFADFFSIDKESLIKIFRKDGYNLSQNNDSDTFVRKQVNSSDEYVEKNLNDLFKESDRCIEFYFVRKDNDLQLMFKFLCAGPALGDYGISLNKLLPYIKYYEFKNEYKLWGKDINSLKGYNLLSANKIEFDNYSILNSGSGYLLPNENKLSKDEFGIVIFISSSSLFYLFLKYQITNNVRQSIVLDILEIKREDLKGDFKLTEYCETSKGADIEIIALVKDNNYAEYFTEIKKAWRANRKTGKFEMIKKKKVKRCGNESFGI